MNFFCQPNPKSHCLKAAPITEVVGQAAPLLLTLLMGNNNNNDAARLRAGPAGTTVVHECVVEVVCPKGTDPSRASTAYPSDHSSCTLVLI